MTDEHQEKAYQNGKKAEREAVPFLQRLFDTVELIDAGYDFLADNSIPIEVKSCQEWQATAHTTTGRRHGRFILMENQHQDLIQNNGLYMFIIHEDDGRVQVRLKRPHSITYRRGLPIKDIFPERV